MKRINKNGLTLVELLTVLIVLILIFLLAITKVNDISNETEKKAVKANALSYTKAVNNYFSLKNGEALQPIYEGLYDLDTLHDIGVRVEGTKPTNGYVINLDNKTRYACLKYKERRAVVKNDQVIKVDLGKCELKFKNGYDETIDVFNANYTGSETTLTISKTGKYLIEAWGAQGGNAQDYIGGYGGYSKGYVDLEQGDILYINVGGKGPTVNKNSSATGGYNGGGNVSNCLWTSSASTEICGAGGGATHVALVTGLLNSLSANVSDILIVAGGGGGAQHVDYSSNYEYVNGGSGGGATGGKFTSVYSGVGVITTYYEATQTSAATIKYATNTSYSGAFGKGSDSPESGGGGGFYGGAGTHGGSSGGSGYIGNKRLSNKVMYCYNCDESNAEASKTNVTEKYSETAMPNTAKVGNGYVRIYFIN